MNSLAPIDHPLDGVARITFNRPEKRNAMSLAARQAVMAALEECRSAKVVLLTGAGPAFCAGIDLKEARAAGRGGNATEGDFSWLAVQEAMRHHPAIMIAVVNGFALGGGVTLINTSELAIAADDAPIGMPEVGFGLYPGLAGPSTQIRLTHKRAAWMVLAGERIDGRTAAAWGLVNASVPADELTAASEAMAAQIARHDATTLKWCKRALWEVPMHISDWTSALQYGEGIGTQIRAQSSVVESGLAGFAGGERTATQGGVQAGPNSDG